MKTNYYRSTAGPVLPSVADAVYASKSLGTCSRLLALAGLEDVLRGEGHFTLFAPTDDAFLNLPPGVLKALEQDPAQLRDALEYHIVSEARELANGKMRTLQGALVTVSVTDDGFSVDHANTCGRLTQCANGRIHPIDAVLMPGFTPQLSAKAREESAWSGRRLVARPVTPDADWPFVDPPR